VEWSYDEREKRKPASETYKEREMKET